MHRQSPNDSVSLQAQQTDMIATLIILLISAILFVSGKVRSDLVALCALLALLLCQILTPAEALSGFSNTTVVMMIYAGNGSTVVAIYHMDNPAVVAYANIQTSSIIMQVPAKLGTNKQNYCTLTSYEFKPYEFNKYANFNDYKYTMKLSYKCDSYKDDGYSKWGCYGYFYDAAGNVISKVHLYCSSLSVGRVYTSEFNVPVNAVRFSVEGF